MIILSFYLEDRWISFSSFSTSSSQYDPKRTRKEMVKEINENLKKMLLAKTEEEFFCINTKEISRLKEEFLLSYEKNIIHFIFSFIIDFIVVSHY